MRPAVGGPTATDRRFTTVARAIADEIRVGSLGDAGHLPSERALVSRFGVSRVTVRRALRELETDGLVVSAAGRGWLVRGDRLEEPEDDLVSFTGAASARGLRATARVLVARTREATLEEAEQLAIAPGAPVVQLDRLRLLDGVPITIDRTLLPEARVPGALERDWTVESLYEVMLAAGAAAVRADYLLRADGADADEARLLGLPVGGPVLRADQVSYDAAGRRVQVCQMTYRGDRYRFHATLARRG